MKLFALQCSWKVGQVVVWTKMQAHKGTPDGTATVTETWLKTRVKARSVGQVLLMESKRNGTKVR